MPDSSERPFIPGLDQRETDNPLLDPQPGDGRKRSISGGGRRECSGDTTQRERLRKVDRIRRIVNGPVKE